MNPSRVKNGLVAAAFCCFLPLSASAQTSLTPPTPVSQTSLNNTAGTPMTKAELKAQQKQQKQQERASNANAKAAKTQAKATKDQDKALREQEKTNGVVPKS